MPSFAPAAPLVAPAASTPATLAWGGSAWVAGSWATVLASAPVASALCAISVLQIDPTPFIQQAEIDVGVGGTGSEVVIATLKFVRGNRFGGPCQYLLPVPIAAIPAGGRVAARLRAQADTTAGVAIGYVATGAGLITTTKALKAAPVGGLGVSMIAPATAWDWSDWGEVTAATAAAWVLAGINFWAVPNLSGECEVEVGVGASGSEVVVARMAAHNDFSVGGPAVGSFLPAVQTGAIGAGVRVAMRVRGNLDPTEEGEGHLHYYEAPL